MSIDGSSVLIIELVSEDIAKIVEQASDCGGTYSFWFRGMVIELCMSKVRRLAVQRDRSRRSLRGQKNRRIWRVLI